MKTNEIFSKNICMFLHTKKVMLLSSLMILEMFFTVYSVHTTQAINAHTHSSNNLNKYKKNVRMI